ncbi:MAG: right-handed parallel beta-helix repeat-containing protein, partial [Candidatus Bathyarchaeota archaeon]
MKVNLGLFCLLMVVASGSLAFTFSLRPLVAKATYVEGDITQDTTWTLIDSPFVLSKNVTILDGSTLTVEPGVEVRFGGWYSLVVQGRLIAVGEENNTITFTSNREEPNSGDWPAIEFNRAESSIMEYCIVEYGENGITISDSAIDLRYNEVAYSRESGIRIAGDNQVTIQNNTLDSNKIGILLIGAQVSGVSITDNLIMSNTQSGIQLGADSYNDLILLNNILSANENGFHVTGLASTHITQNSISYNTIGILYAPDAQMQAFHTDQVAYYNDIYGNIYGIDVSDSFNAKVNAEYNYWGDESGPYHFSL